MPINKGFQHGLRVIYGNLWGNYTQQKGHLCEAKIPEKGKYFYVG